MLITAGTEWFDPQMPYPSLVVADFPIYEAMGQLPMILRMVPIDRQPGSEYANPQDGTVITRVQSDLTFLFRLAVTTSDLVTSQFLIQFQQSAAAVSRLPSCEPHFGWAPTARHPQCRTDTPGPYH